MIAALSLVSAACDGEGAVDLVVDLQTDFVPGVEFVEVRVELPDGTLRELGVEREDDYLRGFRVAEYPALDPDDRVVTTTLLGADGAVVGGRRILVDHRRSLVLSVLVTRDCAAVSCPGPGDPGDHTECVAGGCAPLECVSGAEPSCPEAECASATDCTASTACTSARCVDGACLFEGDDSQCGPGEFCRPESGCAAIPDLPVDAGAPRDAGMMDAGAPDAGVVDAGFCAETPCQLVAPQCGCGGGLVCQRTRGDDPFRECVPPGAAADGELCFNNVECGEGMVCVAATGGVGACTRYCTPAGTACTDPASFCGELFVTSEPIGACMVPCDPVAASGCPGTLGCTLLRTRSLETTSLTWGALCNETGPAAGASCVGLCAPGLVCGSGDVCTEACVIGGAACSMGRTCARLSPRAMLGGVEYGACE